MFWFVEGRAEILERPCRLVRLPPARLISFCSDGCGSGTESDMFVFPPMLGFGKVDVLVFVFVDQQNFWQEHLDEFLDLHYRCTARQRWFVTTQP